jgi:hypothetical protein
MYLGSDGIVRRLKNHRAHAGKLLNCPRRAEGAETVYLAHITVDGGATVVSPDVFLTYEACATSNDINLDRKFDVKEHPVVDESHTDALFGLFQAESAEMVGSVTVWNSIVLTTAVETIPAGTKLDSAQLTNNKLYLCFEGGVTAAIITL